MNVAGKRITVAGASGALGRCLVSALEARGANCRSLYRTRRPPASESMRVDLQRDDLTAALAGADIVVSCAGSSTQPSLRGGWRSFHAADTRMNLRLLEAALRSNVRTFCYISVAGASAMRHLGYVDAHERFVDALTQSSIERVIVRPTGFFSALSSLVDMTRLGVLPVLSGGAASTNPISETDLAEACVDSIEGKIEEREIGGPITYTRREIAELAFRARGLEPRIVSLPRVAMDWSGAILRPFHPRLGQILRFYAHVMSRRCVAPETGEQTLERAFADRARELSKSPEQIRS